MSLPAPFALKKARGRGERVGIVNNSTITGNYVGGGVTVTDNNLVRVDYVNVTLNSGLGAASGAVEAQGFAGQGNNTFRVAFLNVVSGAQVGFPTSEVLSGVSVSGTQISYFAVGE